MKTCAFLSMDSLEDFVCYDHLLCEPLRELGWSVEEISWRNKQVDWNQFEAVIIRSPWDYQQDPEAFMQVLRKINQSSAVLENSFKLVEWNIDKTYLRDLEKQGIEIVPSLWRSKFEKKEFPSFFNELNTEEIVIKPTVSAGADDTFWIRQSNQDNYTSELSSIFSNRPFLMQPFMPNIVSEGEFSLFFFGDTYSHTVLKTPKANDFRVQEEHGGILKKVKPEKELLATAEQLSQTIKPKPLYTRADYVRTANHSFALMEVELIEPSLYFNMDPDSPRRFADVFDKWMRSKTVKG